MLDVNRVDDPTNISFHVPIVFFVAVRMFVYAKSLCCFFLSLLLDSRGLQGGYKDGLQPESLADGKSVLYLPVVTLRF